MLIYLGPDVLMPIASVLGAIGGAILLFWNRLVDLTRAILGRPRRTTDDGAVDGGDDTGDPARMSSKSSRESSE